jgi:nucleoside-diphosphate-sugar epimerase
MRWSPVFPIPGSGRYMRQPLYNRDFCRIIKWCIEHQPDGAVYDIVGQENVYYIDIIKTIKREMGLHTAILPIPYGLFEILLRVYALFSRYPPFVADQLKALAAGDHFEGVDMEVTFGIRPTPFAEAIRETFCDGTYSRVVLKRT